MKPFRKILVPVDFSAHSEHAVRVAAEVARRYEGALSLVHVYDPVAYALPEGYVMFTRAQLDRMFAEFDQQLARLKEVARAAGAPGVETHTRQGIVAVDICEFAREGEFDLIVMGTHGRTGISHLLLGSVAERVVRAAPCPVLTVKAQAAGSVAKAPSSSEGAACCS